MFKCEKMSNHTSCIDMFIDANYLLSAKVLLKIVEVQYMWKKKFNWNALLQSSLNVINIDLCFAKMLKQGQNMNNCYHRQMVGKRAETLLDIN